MGVSKENNASFYVGYNEVHKKDGAKLICIKKCLDVASYTQQYMISQRMWILPKKS